MRKPLVAGNWKMNGSREANRALLSALKGSLGDLQGVDVAVCPPAVYLAEIADTLSGSVIEVGAQDCSDQEKGAYTGELAGSMLAEAGCRYVIVGHSERRERQNETSEWVAAKFIAAQAPA